jgi:hypothetical protein
MAVVLQNHYIATGLHANNILYNRSFIFWNTTPYIPLSKDILNEHVASTFMVGE